MGHSNPGGQHQAGVSNVAGPNIPYHSFRELAAFALADEAIE
jgi:hypothetical protein